MRNILVIELFEMGSATMIAPSLRLLKQQVPQAKIYCLTTEGMEKAWEALGFIPPENILALSGKGLFSFILSAFALAIRRWKEPFDLIIDYNLFLRVSTCVASLLRAKHRAGFYRYHSEGLDRGPLYDIQCAFNQNMHISRNYLALTLSATQSVPKGRTKDPNFKGTVIKEALSLPRYSSRPNVLSDLTKKLPANFLESGPLLVVSPDVGPNLPVRNYPLDRFVTALHRLLCDKPDLRIVLVGTATERSSGEKVVAELANARCINLAGKTTFHELLELLSQAKAVLTNDNGIAHFSALTGTRTVAIFGAETPYMYGPLGDCTVLYGYYHCSPCLTASNHKHTTCTNNLCVKSIPVDDVVRTTNLALSGKTLPATVNNSLPYL